MAERVAGVAGGPNATRRLDGRSCKPLLMTMALVADAVGDAWEPKDSTSPVSGSAVAVTMSSLLEVPLSLLAFMFRGLKGDVATRGNTGDKTVTPAPALALLRREQTSRPA